MFIDNDVLARIVEKFPYPVQVSSADGTIVFMNDAFIEAFKVPSRELVVGKYSMLQDTFVEKEGLREFVSRAFRGEVIHLSDIKIPISDILEMFGKKEVEPDTVFQDITSFPIFSGDNELSYVVSVFITSRTYRGKEEIIKGKEYMDTHWREEFDIDSVAFASGLSRTHFTRLFKVNTGFTPHEYYIYVKINMLKDKLLDLNLSISQAFAACGVDYNGHYARIFKEHAGMTPSEYRRNNRK